jgi:type VI secretion system protein ImpM
VPEPVASPPPAEVCGYGLPEAAVGCYGKIPARGDFVRLGLPRGFVDAWDGWFARVLAASREALGDAWLDAWLEAPIWHFALAPGLCGGEAAIGLWMPSVDRVGRHFPLTLAAVVAGAAAADLIRDGGGFLAAAAAAGLEAVTGDLPPEALFARILDAAAQPPIALPVDPALCPPAGALWWTAGAPRVPSACIATPAMPDAGAFVAMLDAAAADRP